MTTQRADAWWRASSRGSYTFEVGSARVTGPNVVVSTFVVLPRGACSRRRAVPDWTSLGPWSREGRSRFTSASPTSHRALRCFKCPSLSLSLSVDLARRSLPLTWGLRVSWRNAAAYLSLPLPYAATSRDISGLWARETEREREGERRLARGIEEEEEIEREREREKGQRKREVRWKRGPSLFPFPVFYRVLVPRHPQHDITKKSFMFWWF